MKNLTLHIQFLAIILITSISASFAQTGVYVPKDGKVFFSGNAAIFSDVQNDGKLGVGKNASVNFSGKTWENGSQSLITDESNGGEGANGTGGVVKFVSKDTVPQQLIGGYNAASHQGPAFSNLEIQNKAGVKLVGGNTKVRTELKLTEGLLYVNDNILLMGNNNPGTITGYDSLHYIVTDSKTNEGFLLRENITEKDGVVVFPVGSKANAYTPAAIHSRTSRPDNYYVNVVDGVKKDSIKGDVSAQSVNKTWQIGKQLHPNEDQVDITLQHLNGDEGSVFTANKSKTYVAQFTQSTWKELYPQSMPKAGSLTSGRTLINSGVNTKTFNGTISTASYFTKLTGKGDTIKIKTAFWFNGYRLDENLVRIYWKTNPEINNNYFIVQRRLGTESDFTNIDTVSTKSINGISLKDLNYEIKDANKYIGVSFYRLVLIDNDKKSSYSNIIAIAPMPGKFNLTLWPNPTPDKFYVGLNGEVAVKSIVIWNAIGQQLKVESVNGRSIIEFHGFTPGTYMVGFVSTTNQIIETKKVVVLGY